MRFSPYAMTDYGLQHPTGTVLPFNLDPCGHTQAAALAAWNLYWAVTPEIDRFLDLPFGDYGGFRELCATHPFRNSGLVATALMNSPDLVGVLSTDTPEGFSVYFANHTGDLYAALGSGYWQDMALRLPNLSERLEMAQALVEARDAAALCQSVVAVDFRARKRL